MTRRYFLEQPVQKSMAVLVGQEAHHLTHVMRAELGTEVVLFDGSGAELAAIVEHITRSEVRLRIVSRREVDRELPVDVTLGTALPKGDRQKWLVEKAVELGITRLVPLATARSAARTGEKTIGRLRRTVVEASKQCGRNRLMEITPVETFSSFVLATRGIPCRLLAQPSERIQPLDGAVSALRREEKACLAVGPEGGFTREEIERACEAGWQPVDLGPRILRVETAAVLLTAMVIYAGREA